MVYYLQQVYEITADPPDYKVKVEDLKHIFTAEFKGASIFIKMPSDQTGKNVVTIPKAL